MRRGKSLITITLITLLLLQLKLFWLLPFPVFYSINSNQQQILMVVLLLFGLVTFKLRPLRLRENLFGAAIGLFLILYSVEFVWSVSHNRQGIVATFISSNFYLFILFYFFLVYYFRYYDYDMEGFSKIVIVLTGINTMIMWVQFLLAHYGITFTQVSLGELRFGEVRISAISDTLSVFGIILAWAAILFGKHWHRVFLWSVVLTSFFGIVIVSKGRMALAGLVSTMFLMMLLRYRRNWVKILFRTFLLVVLLIGVLHTNIAQSYIGSFNDSSTDTASIRTKEFSYYNALTAESPLLGTGFIRDDGGEETALLRGPQGAYSRTDVGLVGLANSLGVFGVVWYVTMILILARYCFLNLRKRFDSSSLAIFGMFCLCLAYTPIMIMFNPFSITGFVILLACTAHLEYQRNQKAIVKNDNDDQ